MLTEKIQRYYRRLLYAGDFDSTTDTHYIFNIMRDEKREHPDLEPYSRILISYKTQEMTVE